MPTTQISNEPNGFTLIETLAVIAIISIVAGAIALAATTFLRNEGSISARITETRDLQNVTNFLPRDVASARSITKTPAAADECGTAPGGTAVLHLEWDEDWLGTLFSKRVTYRTFTTPSNRIVRYACENSNAPIEFTMADVYDTITFTCTAPTVTVLMTFPGGNRSVTATSRNFLPTAPSC